MSAKVDWRDLELTEDCENPFSYYRGHRPSFIAALREFRSSGSMSGVFFWQDGKSPDDDDWCAVGPQSADEVDWDGFPD